MINPQLPIVGFNSRPSHRTVKHVTARPVTEWVGLMSQSTNNRLFQWHYSYTSAVYQSGTVSVLIHPDCSYFHITAKWTRVVNILFEAILWSFCSMMKLVIVIDVCSLHLRLPPLSKTGVHHESIIQKYVHLVSSLLYCYICPIR